MWVIDLEEKLDRNIFTRQSIGGIMPDDDYTNLAAQEHFDIDKHKPVSIGTGKITDDDYTPQYY